MLEVVGLRKQYRTLTAIANVSFSVSPGEIVGLLGPNGAGKTTTLSVIASLIRPTDGEVRINGRTLHGDTDPLKRSIGLVPQEFALYDELSAIDNLQFFGGLYSLAGSKLATSIDHVLKLVALTDRAGERVKHYSGGMKRRLNLAASLLHDPAILLLDEPTVGIDPQSRNAIFDNLEALRQRGKALVYSTHYMEEAERLCDRVVILDKGRIVAHDTLRNLYRQVATANRIWLELDTPVDVAWIAVLASLPGVSRAEIVGRRIVVEVADLTVASRVLAHVAATGPRINHFMSERPSLESVFLNLTGRSLRDS